MAFPRHHNFINPSTMLLISSCHSSHVLISNCYIATSFTDSELSFLVLSYWFWVAILPMYWFQIAILPLLSLILSCHFCYYLIDFELPFFPRIDFKLLFCHFFHWSELSFLLLPYWFWVAIFAAYLIEFELLSLLIILLLFCFNHSKSVHRNLLFPY
jgi:hypothetical protein